MSGSSPGRRPTAGGAVSSRRGSTRSSPCTCSGTRSTVRSSRPRSADWTASSSRGHPGGPVRRLEACQSPVWDTVLAMIALLDAGVPADDPSVVRAARGRRQRRSPSPVIGRRPVPSWPRPAGPSSSPTIATPMSTTRLRSCWPCAGVPPPTATTPPPCNGAWTGWSGCSRATADGPRSTLTTPARWSPSCPSATSVRSSTHRQPTSTAHAVEMLAAHGQAASEVCRRGVTWLLANQEPGGSWFGRWGANHIYGTGAAVPALVAAGVARDSVAVRRAVRWLHQVQNPDGGWGEDLRSYDDPAWIGRGASTASQTGWAPAGPARRGRPLVRPGAWRGISGRQSGG